MSAYLNNNHNNDGRKKDDKRKEVKSSRIITNHNLKRGNGSAEHMGNDLEQFRLPSSR